MRIKLIDFSIVLHSIRLLSVIKLTQRYHLHKYPHTNDNYVNRNECRVKMNRKKKCERVASTKLNLDFFIRLLSLSIFGNFSTLSWFAKTSCASPLQMILFTNRGRARKSKTRLFNENKIHFNFTSTSQDIYTYSRR